MKSNIIWYATNFREGCFTNLLKRTDLDSAAPAIRPQLLLLILRRQKPVEFILLPLVDKFKAALCILAALNGNKRTVKNIWTLTSCHLIQACHWEAARRTLACTATSRPCTFYSKGQKMHEWKHNVDHWVQLSLNRAFTHCWSSGN